MASTSASSLLFLVSLWTVLMVVIPQSSYLIAVSSVESVGPYWEKLDTIRETFRESIRRDGLTPETRAVRAWMTMRSSAVTQPAPPPWKGR